MGRDLPVTFEPLRELVDELFPVHRSPKSRSDVPLRTLGTHRAAHNRKADLNVQKPAHVGRPPALAAYQHARVHVGKGRSLPNVIERTLAGVVERKLAGRRGQTVTGL
jgi:hypothetical protein